MESSFKIDLKDVLWWISIQGAFRLEALIIAKLSKGRCIPLATRGKPYRAARKHD